MIAEIVGRDDPRDPAQDGAPAERIAKRPQPLRERLGFDDLSQLSLLSDKKDVVNFSRQGEVDVQPPDSCDTNYNRLRACPERRLPRRNSVPAVSVRLHTFVLRLVTAGESTARRCLERGR